MAPGGSIATLKRVMAKIQADGYKTIDQSFQDGMAGDVLGIVEFGRECAVAQAADPDGFEAWLFNATVESRGIVDTLRELVSPESPERN